MEVQESQEKVVFRSKSAGPLSAQSVFSRGTNLPGTSLAFRPAVVKINLYEARKGGELAAHT